MKTRKNIKIVIVEDNHYDNLLLTKYVNTICSLSFFPEFTFDIKSYFSAHECIEMLEDDIHILILDYFLFNEEEPDQLSGSDVLVEVRKCAPECKVILVSSLSSQAKILEQMKKDLYAHVDKNVSSRNRVGSVLQQALNEYRISA